jgi:predicted deacylase
LKRTPGKNPLIEGVAVEQREIGRRQGEAAGATVIAVAGMHGNEPAGVHASRRILEQLAGLPLRGELVVFAGNLGGLRQGLRYLKKDLNRVWTGQGPWAAGPREAEDGEQLELSAAIEEARGRARGPVYLIDLHTTSAAGIPFMLLGDNPAQRRFAAAFPIPVVLGLEEELDGVLSAFWTSRGLITAAIEGGQHDDPATIGSLEAVLWVALAQAGCVDPGFEQVARAAALLDQQRQGLPRVLEVLSRRAIAPEDQFRMEPGFRNIDRARRGQLLAHDRDGEIRAESDGLVIMPLYQGLGGDGYFWGREVSPLRLRASALLQRLGLGRLLGLLPGVERAGADRFTVRKGWLGLFRLLGYRRVRRSGDNLAIERAAR